MSILSKFITANHHYNLAINALEKHHNKEALTEFNRTIELNPRYTLAIINRGKLQEQRLKHPKQAAMDYERALKLDPNDDQTRYRLANLYEAQGHYQNSAHHFYRVMIDAQWTKKGGASIAIKAFHSKQYQKASQLMHRLLSKLDFH